ncbi:MAG: hypothetical protein IJJ96_05920 [Bacteroidales bacterium]|nr:hypothetical protein [Bacteroidales bacterium]
MRHSVLCKWLIPLSVIVASCSQEKESELFEKRDLVISASQEPTWAENPETRTVLVDGVNVHWSPSDKILVFSAGKSEAFTSSNTEVSETANFVGTIDIPESSASDPYVRALYPYTSSASMQGGTVATALPTSQRGFAGTFDDDLVILASRGIPPTESGSSTVSMDMVFKHVCSGIKFSLTRDDIKRVKLTSRGGEAVAGSFAFKWNNGGDPIVSSVTSPSTSVTVSAPTGEAFTPGVWYYIVTLPVDFSTGVTFTLTNSDNISAERVIETAFSLGRGAFSSATNLDADIEFVTPGGDEPGPDEPDVEVQVAGPDTWVATDELQRTLPVSINGTRSDGKVLIFYWTWHCENHANYPQIVDITGTQGYLRKKFFNDSDFSNSIWGDNHGHDPCFWGTPLFGYYRSTDAWVLRKHAEMLADAGVDAIVFDCTNGEFLWESSVDVLLPTWLKAKNDGVKVPQIVFHLNYQACQSTENTLTRIYQKYYSNSSYDDLWFKVDNNPLVIAYPASTNNSTLRGHFTFRPGQPDYVAGDMGDGLGNHQWGWLQNNPQNVFGENEEIPVGVAQNACDDSHGHCYAFNAPNTYGRSYTKANGQDLVSEGSYIQGYNFQEQWDYAFTKNPNYIFVTGWNEWTANRQDSWPVYTGTVWCGPYPNAFPDQYDSERSRDIEPNKIWGDNGDNYYYQLVNNIRKFKGAGSYPNVTRPKTMEIDGDFTGWDKVSPDFKHYPGNTVHRDATSQSTKTTQTYKNSTGRNDFVDARVTRDNEYVYFYVETKADISDYRNDKWMRLLIDIDMNWNTGWKGYDFCLNYVTPSSPTKGFVSVASGENGAWGWRTDDNATFDYAVNGNKMEIRVPRSLLGLSANEKLDFGFKWADNNLYDVVPEGRETRILNLYVDGDAAPGGRFNFHYKEPVE